MNARQPTALGRLSRRAVAGPAALSLLLLATGCPPPSSSNDVAQVRELRDRMAGLERELADREDAIRRQSKQIEDLQRQAVGERLAKLPRAARIEVDPLTGGYDADGAPGDDGVVVYLRPHDADGDPLKAPGDVRVQLLDLAAEPAGQLVGELTLEADALRKTWYSKFLTAHYTIRVPWRAAPPARPDLTVRTRFVDLVSGQAYEDVRAVRVRLASAGGAPTGQP